MRFVLILLTLSVVSGCRATPDDDLLVREAAFREFLPKIQCRGPVVFIAFDYDDSLKMWDSPSAAFVQRLSGVNSRVDLLPVSEMERDDRDFPFFFERSKGRIGCLVWARVKGWKGNREATVRVGYSGGGPLDGHGYEALMKKRGGRWVTYQIISGWVS